MSRTGLVCSLGAMQPGHGHSKCSHLEGAERIMTTEGGQRATGESEFKESDGAVELWKQMGRWTDMSPCEEFISQYTK